MKLSHYDFLEFMSSELFDTKLGHFTIRQEPVRNVIKPIGVLEGNLQRIDSDKDVVVFLKRKEPFAAWGKFMSIEKFIDFMQTPEFDNIDSVSFDILNDDENDLTWGGAYGVLGILENT